MVDKISDRVEAKLARRTSGHDYDTTVNSDRERVQVMSANFFLNLRKQFRFLHSNSLVETESLLRFVIALPSISTVDSDDRFA